MPKPGVGGGIGEPTKFEKFFAQISPARTSDPVKEVPTLHYGLNEIQK